MAMKERRILPPDSTNPFPSGLLILALVSTVALSGSAGNQNATSTFTNSPGSKSAGRSIVRGSEDASRTGSSSEEIEAASPSLKDIKAAVAKAKAGDTVIVPAGKATWNGQLVLTKGVKFIGAGAGRTVITSGYKAPTLYDSTGYLIAYLPESPGRDEPFRLSGFTFDLTGECQWITIQNPTTSAIRQLRIDHNSVSGSPKRNIVIRGAVYGVIDSNEMTGGLMLTAYGSNATSWNHFRFDFGTADNIYFEDNICTISTTPHDGGVGGRYCARFNKYIYVNQTRQLVPWFDMHGNQGPGKNWAGMGVEIYENVLEGGGRTAMIAAIRGGKALVYDNRVNTTSPSKAWTRVREEYNDSLNPPAVSPISGQPQHVSDTYFWGNRQNGYLVSTTIGETIDYGGSTGVVPRRNVHFWDQVPNFDGTSGVGVGPLADRPAKGVVGVAYWASDANKLSRWTADNKWDEFYAPYTYPHPLRTIL